MKGLFILTCYESNWLNHDFFASKPKKGKRSGRYVAMKHFRKWKNSVLVSLEVLGVLEGDEMTNLKI